MIIGYLRSKKGSTLMLVLIALAVLSILGTTILSLALVNLKVKMADRREKASFYIAEAGLDEAYAIIGETIEAAIENSKTEAQDYLNLFLARQQEREERDRNNKDLSYGQKFKSPYYYHWPEPDMTASARQDKNGNYIDHVEDGILVGRYAYDDRHNIVNEYDPDGNLITEPLVGQLIQDKSNEKLRQLFVYCYADYINGKLKDKLDKRLNFSTDLTDVEVENFQGFPAPPLDESTEASLSDNPLGYADYYDSGLESKVCTIDFKSIKNVKNADGTDGHPVTIETTLSVKIPSRDFDYVSEVTTDNARLMKNVLWERAITVGSDNADKGKGNLYVDGSDVTINGDVYVYGTKPDSSHIKEPLYYGGIIAGASSKGVLTINGNVYTARYIQTRNDGSSITLNGSESYCDSIVAQEGSTNSSITVNGDINVRDDTELNGTTCNVKVTGNYIGFSTGSGIQSSHDNSSSIVINSRDINEGIGKGSSINLEGNGDTKNYEVKVGDRVENLEVKGVYLGGTVYVDLTDTEGRDASYQTGESVAVKGNYIAYTKTLVTEGTPEKYRNLDESTYFTELPPLILVTKYKNGDNAESMGAREKAEYFFYADKEDPSFLNLGGKGGINIKNVKFSTGNYIDTDADSGEGEIKAPEIADAPTFQQLVDIKNHDYLYYANIMGDSQITDHRKLPLTDMDESHRLKVSDRFDFTRQINRQDQLELSRVNENKEIIYAKSDNTDPVNNNKKLVIEGTGAAASVPRTGQDDYIKLDGAGLKGIIVTNRDVYLTGTIDYKGVIVTTGNLYFMDNNKKTITNDYDYVINKVYADIKDSKTTGIGDLFTQDPTWTQYVDFTFESTAGVATDSNLSYRRKLNGLIEISNWKKK